ncbi:TPA: restriction endonuclease subunit S [Acinetobacter baumannii]|nr:restriction endonuclease subunit S [Acinetobacter baumannii]HEN9518689.1 restriction endonuclease subunit S [Acinetobacter baumannii]
MSFLEKLLDGVKVEWKILGEAVNFQRGKRLVRSQLEEIGDYAVYQNSMTPLGYYHESNVQAESAFIICAGAAGEIGFSQDKFWAADDVYFAITPETINSRFLYHFLLTQKEKIKGQVRRASIPRLSKSAIEKLNFPIPCPENPEKSLKIQAEIVRILDAFSAMTTELTAELNIRKEQYNYYRDQLLSFKDGEAEWNALGDIGEFTYGYAAKAQDFGNARFVRITDINANGKLILEEPKYVDISDENEKYLLKKNDLLMARTGATFGKTMIFEEDYPAIYAGFLIKLSLDEKIVNPKYYWHFAQSDLFWNQANKLVSGGGQPQFNANALKQVKMPLPYPQDTNKSLIEQARIVSILDKFDAITSSIREGLPREIELRQQQYEYYRDLLFSFPKPEEIEA